MLLLLGVSELFAMTVWFSASAVSPALQSEWGLSRGQIAWLVMGVQLGFVTGTLVIVLTNLADLFNTRVVVAVSAFFAGLTNGVFALLSAQFLLALSLRFLTGIFLAGVYPPAMKIIAGWFKQRRGLAIGVLVGALTIGSASPHLVGTILRESWQTTILASSALSIVAAVILLSFVKDGPYDVPAQSFDFKYALTVMRDRPIRLAYFGYFGHMWELYAMWTWVPVFLMAKTELNSLGPNSSSGFWAFLVIAAGSIGCVAYGFWADRIGRARSTISAMVISGLCCFVVGFMGNSNTVLLLVLCVVWGVTVVGDSAQFSAAASELCDPQYMGTVLTLQTSIGFLLTMISIRLVPMIQELGGWGFAFGILGLGPVAGIVAMHLLRKSPEAIKMASGNR